MELRWWKSLHWLLLHLDDPESGMTPHSWHSTVHLRASSGLAHLCHTPAPLERNTHPFVSALLLVVLWQKLKWRWPNVLRCKAVQPRVLGAPAGSPQRMPRSPWGEECRRVLAAVASSLSSMEGVGSHIFSYTESHFSPFSGSFSFSNEIR